MTHDRLRSIEQRIIELREAQRDIERAQRDIERLYTQRAHKSPSVFSGVMR